MYTINRFLLENVLGKHNDVPDNEFDFDQLKMGIAVEREHTDSDEVAKMITKDHLSTCPKYYTYLKQMEKDHCGGED